MEAQLPELRRPQGRSDLLDGSLSAGDVPESTSDDGEVYAAALFSTDSGQESRSAIWP